MERNRLAGHLARFGSGVGIHQLSEPVSILIQGQFYMQSRELRQQVERGEVELDEEALMRLAERIAVDGTTPTAMLSHVFIHLACTGSIRVLRFIEGLLPELTGEARAWALLAHLDLKMRVLSDLLDEQQVVLSSGLGGEGTLIRINGYCIHRDFARWEPYQRELMSRELADACTGVGGRVEEELWGEEYMIYRCLLPYHTEVARVVESFIASCNQYGEFILSDSHVTNVDLLSHDVVQAHIRTLRSRANQSDSIDKLLPEELRPTSDDD